MLTPRALLVTRPLTLRLASRAPASLGHFNWIQKRCPQLAVAGDSPSAFAGVRAMSGSHTPPNSDDVKAKELTPFQKLQKMMQPFMQGSKALYQENKTAWKIRQRLKQSTGDGKSAPQLTRQEMLVLRQAHRDLLKSLPLLALFCVPLLGYVAPVIGFQFPKQLLPSQFWRPDQKTQFLREDAQARAAYYPELVQLLLQIDRKDKCLQEMLAAAKAKEASADAGLLPVQVSELVPFFQEPAALSKLSRHHVHVLSQSIALVPAFASLLKLVPAEIILKQLEKRTDQLSVDDQMLLKEGIDDLSLSELEFACEERGITSGYGDIEALRSALREWLSMYDTDHLQAPAFPTSLLLHAPALARFSTQDEETTA